MMFQFKDVWFENGRKTRRKEKDDETSDSRGGEVSEDMYFR